MSNSIATGISNVDWFEAINQTAKARFESLDLSAVLMYIIDNCPESALFYLAGQFDVLGLKGWNIAQTEAERRELIKRAIELHRFKGTPFSIKEAVKSVGFDDIEIIEGVGVDYDGEYDYDGTITYAGGNWATFRVIIFLPNDFTIDAGNLELTRDLILEYKNARSHLVGITFRLVFNDTIEPNDDFLDLGDPITDNLPDGISYDGFGTYDGEHNYNYLPDIISLQIYDQFGNLIQSDEF